MTDIDNPVKCNRVEITRTRKNKPVANLYAPRLEFPVLQLFDLAELVTIGIDPNSEQKEHAVIFLAHWQEGEKLNSKTNPYRNVTRLEPLAALAPTPATSDPEALAAVVAQLDRIERKIDAIRAAAASPFDYFYGDGEEATIPEEKTAFTDYRRAHAEAVPANREALRQWVRMKNRTTQRPLQVTT